MEKIKIREKYHLNLKYNDDILEKLSEYENEIKLDYLKNIIEKRLNDIRYSFIDLLIQVKDEHIFDFILEIESRTYTFGFCFKLPEEFKFRYYFRKGKRKPDFYVTNNKIKIDNTFISIEEFNELNGFIELSQINIVDKNKKIEEEKED